MSDEASITPEMVRKLRELTGAGIMDCKRALQETGGDQDAAVEILRTKGLAQVGKRSGRAAKEGVVHAYIHGEGRIGVLVEVNCETDFVARTEEFQALAREVAMQVAALPPRWVARDDAPADVIEGERKIYGEQARETGKPENVVERIVEGKLEAFYRDSVLLDAPYIRDDSRTVGDLVTEVAAKVGENVIIRRFARFQLGEDA